MVLFAWILLHAAEPVFYVSPALSIPQSQCEQLAKSWLEARVKMALYEHAAEGRGAWISRHQCVSLKLGHNI